MSLRYRLQFLVRRFKAWIYSLTHTPCTNYEAGDYCECEDCRETCSRNGHCFDGETVCFNCGYDCYEDLVCRAYDMARDKDYG